MAVTKGQVLARLDDTTERSHLALAEAQLGAARDAVAELEVRHEEARLELARQIQLLDQRVIRQAELGTAQAEVDSLEARIANQRRLVASAGPGAGATSPSLSGRTYAPGRPASSGYAGRLGRQGHATDDDDTIPQSHVEVGAKPD